MKLVLYNTPELYLPHPKNFDGLQRMCYVHKIEFEHTRDEGRTYQDNYDILVSYDRFINPDKIPQRIKIIYGPGLFVFPTGDVVGPLRNDLVGRCAYNSLSEWVKNMYLDVAKSLVVPVEPFPFGVETGYFCPDNNDSKEYDCLLYVKSRSTELAESTKQLLEQKGLRYRVFKYGSYVGHEYLNCLKRSKFMVVLDAHESQGFAIQEAMSCNVPLLVFNIKSMYDEMPDGKNQSFTWERHGPNLLLATTVPYWSDECGMVITEQEQLSESIDTMIKTYTKFTPRDYVLRTLSNEVCMQRILDYFNLKSPLNNS